MQPAVAIINRSSLPDEDVRLMAQGVALQVQNDYSPVWSKTATISFVDTNHVPPMGKWWVVLLDDSDTATSMEFHDVTPDGLPLAKVFTGHRETKDVSTSLSHETLELLADPYTSLSVQSVDGTEFAAFSICDPVGGTEYGYTVDVGGNSVAVSDFVHPEFFNAKAEEDTIPFDQTNRVSGPLQVLPFGCLMVWSAQQGWKCHTTSQFSLVGRPVVGSRRERRRTLKPEWIRSSFLPQGLPVGEEQLT